MSGRKDYDNIQQRDSRIPMKKYLRVFQLLAASSFQSFLVSRVGAILFLLGKILRFLFFLSFLILLVTKTKVLVGYNLWQIILFYLTFNFIDASTQMLFREVYRFRQQIVSGNFDLVLVKPVSALFRSLFGWTDLLDLITLLPFFIAISVVMSHIPDITVGKIFLYIFLIINALCLAASFHIFVLALAILTTEIDHAIMMYRDITSMGKLPIDIYQEPLRSLMTFVIPVGIMITFPAKALLGLLDMQNILLAVMINVIIFVSSISLWRYALREYTSASS